MNNRPLTSRPKAIYQKLVDSMRRARSDTSGTVAVTFSLVSLPLLLVVGAALDFTRTGPAATNLQSAVDSALLGGVIAAPGTQVDVATKLFAANVATAPYASTSANFSVNSDGSLSGAASGTIRTSVMSIAGVNTLTVRASGKAMPPQTPSTITFQVTAAYGWWWKEVDLFTHKPGDATDTLVASYIYQPNNMTGSSGRGTGATSAQFLVNGLMTPNAVTTPVIVGSLYDKIYLKMTVYSDGCGPGQAPNPNTPMNSNQNNFQCVTSGSTVNNKTVKKSASPTVFSTNDAATARNLFIGDPEVDLPANKIPNIFTLIPCGVTIQHAWEDTAYGPGPNPDQNWAQQDIFFKVKATACGINPNYPSAGATARLIQ